MAEVKNLVKFFRGPKTSYVAGGKHKNAIYFATDTRELLMNGNSYGVSSDLSDLIGKKIESVKFTSPNKIEFFTEASTEGSAAFSVELPNASSSNNGLMSSTDFDNLAALQLAKSGYDSWKAKETEYDSFKAKETGYDSWKAKEGGYDTFKAKEGGYDTWKAKEGGYDTFKAKETGYDNFVALKGQNNGLAELDENGKVPSSQLPSFVDDVVESADFASLPEAGETGKIYVTLDDNKTFRWGGSSYVEISSSLALGETESTAYAGSKGKQLRTDFDKFTSETYVNDKQTLNESIGTKVSTETYNAKVAELEQSLGNKATTTSLEEAVKAIDGKLEKKVETSVYDAKVVEINGKLDKKVETSVYEAKVGDINKALEKKVESSVYDAKVAQLEGAIADAETNANTYTDTALTWSEEA